MQRVRLSASAIAIAITMVSMLASARSAEAADARAATQAVDQTSDAKPTAPDDRIQDIVVTAQKRSESVNKIALSIQAFSGVSLKRAGITDVGGLVQVTPGLSFAQSSGNTPILTLRGVGFNTPNASSTSPVGIYVDEVAYAYPYMSGGPLYDVARVEVLKGPQGTLYGRNTTGGLINFITAQPGKDFEAGGTVEVGNYGAHNFEGYISGSVTDTLRVRLAGRSENSSDGWQHSLTRPSDTLGKVDRQAFRLTLDWTPTPALDVNLMGSYWKNKSDTIAAQAVGYTPQHAAFATPGEAASVHANWANDEADWAPATAGVPPLKTNSEFYSLAARLSYQLNGNLSLISLTGYNHVKRYDNNDESGTPYVVFDDLSTGSIGSFSQELRIVGNLNKLKFILGGYYSFDKISDDQVGYYHDSSTSNLLRYFAQNVIDPTNQLYSAAQYSVGFSNYRNILSETSRSASVFANFDYPIFDQLKLTAGARYTDDKLKYGSCSADYNGITLPIWNTVVEALAGNQPINSGPNAVTTNGCLTFNSNYQGIAPFTKTPLDQDNFAGRISLQYSPVRDSLFYATVSRGYKSAVVPVLAANVASQLDPAVQERVTNYEAGGKLGLFDRRVQFNFAGFYSDYKNKQLFSDVLDPIFTSLERIVNIPKSNIKGGEIELTWKATSVLQFNLGGSYVKSKITSFVGYDRFGVEHDYAGSQFPYTPNWQGNAGATYDAPLTAKSGLLVAVNASHQSSSSATIGTEAGFGVKAYTVVNLNTAIHAPDYRWSVGAYVKNLFNENYWTSVDVLTDTIFRIPAMPRTYGVRLSWKY